MLRMIGIIGCLALAACAPRDDLSVTPDPIGGFRLGHNVAVANTPTVGPFSRQVSDEAWEVRVTQAVDDRLGQTRFFGDRFFHVGVAVDGYVLAQPGIPLVYQPRSVLIFTVNFFEDATQSILNPEPIQLTVFEPCCTIPFLGSGLTRSAEEQLDGLAFNAARAIERTMRENAAWFGGVPEVLPADDTILEGNVIVENPELIAPEQTPPS